MQILIQKFGGTSVSTKANRQHVIRHIKSALNKYDKVVVVVSALGREPEPYATDTLLSLVNYPSHHATNRELDLLMSCGEIISSIVLSNELRKQNISSIALTGSQAGIITNDDFTQAKIKQINQDNILNILQKYNVAVIAGFQGITETGEVTTIGRGGSDTTAVALGAALKAERIEIYTDVLGIMTADPKIVKKAKLLHFASYLEICHLAYQGTKVVDPRAIEVAMQAKIPIRVRSTYSEEKGTLVTTPSAISEKNMLIEDRLVTGIAYLQGIIQIHIQLKEGVQQLQSSIFKAMANAGISVDFINISPSGLIFTVPTNVAKRTIDVLSALDLKPNVKYNCAKVSVIGAGMSGVPGIASTIVGALTDQDIQILQSADSYTTIWVLIDEKDLFKAVNALHDVFQLNKNKIESKEVN